MNLLILMLMLMLLLILLYKIFINLLIKSLNANNEIAIFIIILNLYYNKKIIYKLIIILSLS